MKKLLSCKFNIDTACVELKYDDGSMISINCTAVENELDASMLQRGEFGLACLQQAAGICRACPKRRHRRIYQGHA